MAAGSTFKPLYYFYGDEDFLVDEAVTSLKDRVLSGGSMDSLNYRSCNAADKSTPIDAVAVVEEALTMPAFSSSRLIIIKNADALSAEDSKVFAEYVKDPSPTTCLVFSSYTRKLDKRTTFVKLMEAGRYTTRFYKLGGVKLLAWINGYVKGQGKEFSGTAASMLTSVVGDKLRDLKGEIDKLISYVGDNKQVTVDDVAECVMDIKEQTAFDLADAISRKDAASSFALLRKLDTEEPIKVLGAVTWQFRTLIKAAYAMDKGMSGVRLASFLKVREAYAARYEKAARKFTRRELASVIHNLKKTDVSLKSSGYPRHLILDRFVIEMCLPRS